MFEKIPEAVWGIGPDWYKWVSGMALFFLGVWIVTTPIATKHVTLYKMFLETKPVIEFKIAPNKVLTILNGSLFELKNLRVYATRYTFDESEFVRKSWKMKNFNRIGGAIKVIETLKARNGVAVVDLKQNSLIHLFDNPGRESNEPMITYYCLRIVFTKAPTSEKYVHYRVTSAIKDFPSFVDNTETTATAGGPEWADFLIGVVPIIKAHQKKMFVHEDQPLIEL